jgi:hypothetical protein
MTGRRLGRQEAQMTGTTRTIQQPASTGSILAVLGVTVAIVGAAVAIALGSANAGKSTQPVAAPAPLYAPTVRDLGSRDQGNTTATGAAAGTFADHGWSETGTAGFGPKGDQLKDDLAVGSNQGATGYHGFGNPADRPSISTSGSNGDAPAGRNLALRAQ